MASFVGNVATAQELMWLPKDAVIAGVYILGAANATAAATDTTVAVAGGSDADGIVIAYNLETGGAGYNPVGAQAGALVGTKLTTDTKVTATLSAAVAGDAALSWTLKIEYFVSGNGESF
jgi:hypothetical protein